MSKYWAKAFGWKENGFKAPFYSQMSKDGHTWLPTNDPPIEEAQTALDEICVKYPDHALRIVDSEGNLICAYNSFDPSGRLDGLKGEDDFGKFFIESAKLRDEHIAFAASWQEAYGRFTVWEMTLMQFVCYHDISKEQIILALTASGRPKYEDWQ